MKATIKLLPVILAMPVMISAQTKPTSYDSDGDGIPDSVDECPFVKGLPEFKGCPYEKKITATDRDGDGVQDADDACPDIFGLKSNRGCPDVALNQTTPTAPNNGDVVSANPTSLFTTKSTSREEEKKDFKTQLLALVSESKNMFADMGSKIDSTLCLPGALDCQLKTGKGVSYEANFGTYDDQFSAGEKFNGLKALVMMALGENGWDQNEISNNGYIEKYEFRQTVEGRAPASVVTVSALPAGNRYCVHITVGKQSTEEKGRSISRIN